MVTKQQIRDTCRLALHDAICLDGEGCDLRGPHSQSPAYYIQWSSIADAMIRMLTLEPEPKAGGRV